MDYRPLGRTGVQVSKLCLGTMMFGAWGNPDHDDSIRIIHRALDAGDQLRRHRRRLLGRRVRGDRRQGAQGPPRRRRARHQVLGPDGRGPQPRRRLAPLDHRRGRELAAAARHRLDRPLPDAPPRPGGRHRRDPRRARPTSSSRARSATSAPRRSRPARSSRRSGSARERRPRALPHRAAALLAARPRRSSSTCCRPRGATAWASSPTARWPAAGCRAAGPPTAPRPRPPASGWRRASTCRCPRTSASSKPSSSSPRSPTTPACRSIELAIAFVVNHPAVTSAIIGPRTMEQLDSQLPAADVVLDAAVARPHRRDRPPRRQPQPRRHQLRRAGPRARPAPALNALPDHGGELAHAASIAGCAMRPSAPTPR